MNFTKIALATAALALSSAAANAADISGAGATFPYPIYAKWADAYKKETGSRPQLPVDRLGRRHQADQGQDRDLRRLRCAAAGQGARRSPAWRSSPW